MLLPRFGSFLFECLPIKRFSTSKPIEIPPRGKYTEPDKNRRSDFSSARAPSCRSDWCLNTASPPINRVSVYCRRNCADVIDLDNQPPGRPRKIARQRSARVRQRVAAFHERAAVFVAADPLVRAAEMGPDLESLYLAREELAREAAGLLFMRLQAVPGSIEMGRLASRRIAALREVANLTVAIARAGAGAPSPERMARIMTSLFEVVDEASASVLPEDVAAKFARAWRERAQPLLEECCSPDGPRLLRPSGSPGEHPPPTAR